MKRFLFLILLVTASSGVSAATIDRDLLVTSDGTVYGIKSLPIGDLGNGAAGSELALTVQRGLTITRSVVPETLNSGINRNPVLTYDVESKTLLLVWLRIPNAVTSEILVASYQNGKWERAVSIDSRSYLVRSNLSVGITRRILQLQRDGTYADSPALLLHAAWWEQGGGEASARYALVQVEAGAVRSIQIHDLREFIEAPSPTDTPDPDADRELIRHVAVFEGPDTGSVDVLFADASTSTFHRVTLKPVVDARVRIPVGARPGLPGGPTHFAAAKALPSGWSGRTTTITSRDGNTLVFCNTLADRVSYLSYNASTQTWSSVKEIGLSEAVTAEIAVSALAKMVATQ